MTKNDLIDLVVKQVKRDLLDGETQAFEILLSNVSVLDLEGYLPSGTVSEEDIDLILFNRKLT